MRTLHPPHLLRHMKIWRLHSPKPTQTKHRQNTDERAHNVDDYDEFFMLRVAARDVRKKMHSYIALTKEWKWGTHAHAQYKQKQQRKLSEQD